MRAFRSLLLPLKAVLLNLLSVSASYGMLVVVFRWAVLGRWNWWLPARVARLAHVDSSPLERRPERSC